MTFQTECASAFFCTVMERRAGKPPFVWNDEDRCQRPAALDALFFHLYGITDADAACIMDTFPIVRGHDTKAFVRYRTRDGVLAQLRWKRGLGYCQCAPPRV